MVRTDGIVLSIVSGILLLGLGCAKASGQTAVALDNKAASAAPAASATPDPKSTDQTVLAKYSYLDPDHLVPQNLLQQSILYFNANSAQFENQNVMTVIDYAKNSSEKRMFIIDMKTGSVWALHVAHGHGSEPDPVHDGWARQFGDAENSGMTALGFYRVAETYDGDHGLSIRLDGLSDSNSLVRERDIVVHGADYVSDIDEIQGRSLGCPAVSMANRDRVVGLVAGGSLMYMGLSVNQSH